VKIFTFLLLIIGAALAFAKDTPYPKESLIQIVNYDSSSSTYEIVSQNFPNEDHGYTTPQALCKAAPSINLNDIRQHPTRIISWIIKIDNTLTTLDFDEIVARKATKNSP
jgi:hypothetical protein